MTQGTPTRRLADMILDQPLEHFVATRREAGVSWRVVARDLCERTDGALDITGETLRSWFPDDRAGAA